MRARTRWRVRIVLIVTLVSAAIGSGSAGATSTFYWRDLLVGASTGALTGAILSVSEIVLLASSPGALRRQPLALALGLRTIFYGAVFIGSLELTASLLGVRSPVFGPGGTPIANLIFAGGVSVAVNFYFTLRRLIGPRTLAALATGRYHDPREEERIVLFLDLEGSTQLAERLGDRDFHRFLNQVFFDLADPVLESRGEIYRYIGDEIIVTWPLERGLRGGACIVCVFAVTDALAARRSRYLRDFAAVPRLRAALHAGPLVLGEMGDIKREIVMLGDTMNTAARIEEVCRVTGHDCILSEQLLRHLGKLPPGASVTQLAPIPLRGKTDEISLFALSRN